MKKIVIITTVSMSLSTLIKGQPRFLSNYFDINLVCSPSSSNDDISKFEGVHLESIEMSRQITILKDLKSLFKLLIFLYKTKPDMVYTFTPKAGLLGMLASFILRVPNRIHNVVGMPLMEAKGLKKRLLRLIEKITYSLSTNLLCNSFGLKKYMETNLTNRNVKVIAKGSINGVDGDFFLNNKTNEEQNKIRKKLEIDEDDVVLTFVGRIVKDKGINELIEAFISLKKYHTKIKLLLVGDYEEHLNPIKKENFDLINSDKDIIFVGFKNDIREYLSISDMFILPSYREGLPNSLIEAGSFGIPLIASDINGCNEIIIPSKTGILVKKKDKLSLEKGIDLLLKDKKLYNNIKSSVREITLNRYSQKYFLNELKETLESTF